MFKVEPNSQYNLAPADSWRVRLITYQRRRMYDRFLSECGVRPADSILDVGVTRDQEYESSNYLEAWYPLKGMITAVGLEDASFLEKVYPGVKFVQADGLCLPFANDAFDVVHSSAVLEHVGSLENQSRLVAECARVARRAVFFTTPNRWFPVEFHTGLPLLHWLPKHWFRALMRSGPLAFFAEEGNLNLMAKGDLVELGPRLAAYRFSVSSVSLLGWPSNLLLVGHK